MEQILWFVTEVEVNLTAKFKVAKLSQPTLFTRVAVLEPAAAKVNPFQTYGNADEQILKFVVELDGSFTARFKVAILSQPALFVKVAVFVPAAAKVSPFHT